MFIELKNQINYCQDGDKIEEKPGVKPARTEEPQVKKRPSLKGKEV